MKASWTVLPWLVLGCASEPLDEPPAAGGAGVGGLAAGGLAAGGSGEAGGAPYGGAAGEAGQGGSAGDVVPGGEGGALGEVTCPQAGQAQDVSVIAADAVTEASGLAASRRFPGVLYVHNDSGAGPFAYALRDDGSLIASLELSAALAQDWEDMAVGPGPDAAADYLYFADIGDNAAARSGVVVHRALEPELDLQASDQALALDFDSLYFDYPDGARDAETLLVDPETSDLYIVSKSAAGSQLYVARAPHSTEAITVLEHAGAVPLPPLALATGGDIAPDGSLVLLRTYEAVLGWPRQPDQTIAEALAAEPCSLPAADEAQGEAIAVAADGSGYFTLSEGADQTLHRSDFE